MTVGALATTCTNSSQKGFCSGDSCLLFVLRWVTHFAFLVRDGALLERQTVLTFMKGCGTMGIAIISGMLTSLEARPTNGIGKPTQSQSGTSTPLPSYMLYAADDSLPSRFIACVRRPDSAKKLKKLFANEFAERGEYIEVLSGENVDAAKRCDVLLLWYATCLLFLSRIFIRRFSCKPQLAEQILEEEGMKSALKDKLVISIMAGITISQISDWLDISTRVVRAMPNTPSKVQSCNSTLLC